MLLTIPGAGTFKGRNKQGQIGEIILNDTIRFNSANKAQAFSEKLKSKYLGKKITQIDIINTMKEMGLISE